MKKKSRHSPKSQANPLWGGHYRLGPATVMTAINTSLHIDQRLYAQDIEASQAHALMLGRHGIVSKKDAQRIIKGLDRVKKEIRDGRFKFRYELEDIHMNIEYRLSELIGETAGRLHTARSRNDQVVTDFRLWLRGEVDQLLLLLTELEKALIKKAEHHTATVMPGYTHLQAAQPVTFGHHLHAYVEMLSRDHERLTDCRKRINELPLGAAALAGTSFAINRAETAHSLGFSRIMANSMDAVSARDFALEFLACASILGMHLSRLSEEIILWVSPAFQFIKLSEAFTTGSSIMPQKRNPDAAELVRAKAGRLIGNFVTLSTILKALPLTYAKDLQEDKGMTFDSVDTLQLCLTAMTGIITDLEPQPARMRLALNDGYITATDLADWLVRELNMPFRKAHHVTGRIVRLAESQACRLDELPLGEMQKVEPRLTKDIYTILDPEKAVKSRTSLGGTAPKNVAQALRTVKRRSRSQKI